MWSRVCTGQLCCTTKREELTDGCCQRCTTVISGMQKEQIVLLHGYSCLVADSIRPHTLKKKPTAFLPNKFSVARIRYLSMKLPGRENCHSNFEKVSITPSSYSPQNKQRSSRIMVGLVFRLLCLQNTCVIPSLSDKGYCWAQGWISRDASAAQDRSTGSSRGQKEAKDQTNDE